MHLWGYPHDAEAGNISFSDVDVDSGQAPRKRFGLEPRGSKTSCPHQNAFMYLRVCPTLKHTKYVLFLKPLQYHCESHDIRMMSYDMIRILARSRAKPRAGGRQRELVPVWCCPGWVTLGDMNCWFLHIFTMKNGHSMAFPSHDATTGHSAGHRLCLVPWIRPTPGVSDHLRGRVRPRSLGMLHGIGFTTFLGFFGFWRCRISKKNQCLWAVQRKFDTGLIINPPVDQMNSN